MIIHGELLVGCPPGIMNVILAAEHSPCDEFDDYGDHLDWNFCAFRALDNGWVQRLSSWSPSLNEDDE